MPEGDILEAAKPREILALVGQMRQEELLKQLRQARLYEFAGED